MLVTQSFSQTYLFILGLLINAYNFSDLERRMIGRLVNNK
jgi:hypothetical protein